jgi:hypothetical protein
MEAVFMRARPSLFVLVLFSSMFYLALEKC